MLHSKGIFDFASHLLVAWRTCGSLRTRQKDIVPGRFRVSCCYWQRRVWTGGRRAYCDFSDNEAKASWTVVPGGPGSLNCFVKRASFSVRCLALNTQAFVHAPKMNWPSSDRGRPCTWFPSTCKSSSPGAKKLGRL